MTGDTLEHLCVRHIRGSIRAVVGFLPGVDEAWVVLVGEHTRAEGDVYELLYELSGILPETGRSKPACCDEGQPPDTDPLLVEILASHTRRLLAAAKPPPWQSRRRAGQ